MRKEEFRTEWCFFCNGNGFLGARRDNKTCPSCRGRKRVTIQVYNYPLRKKPKDADEND